MELFPDKARVRLRSIVRGTFLYADEDGRGVSLTGRRESLHTEWLVHRVKGDDGYPYVLLHSAAYGRYLCVSLDDAPFGHRGRAAVQGAYDAPQQADLVWEGIEVGDNVVVMRHVSGNLLRANGKYDGVSVDDASSMTTMVHWKVEATPPRPVTAPPALPGGPIPVTPVLRRRIHYVQANHHEELNTLAWSRFWLDGRSVLKLKAQLANELDEENFHNITLCVRAGSQGRLTPLVTDLPADEVTMEVIVLFTEPQDHFPRQSGCISDVPGWDRVLLGHAGPSDLLISAQPSRSNTVLHLRLWTGQFIFCELRIKMVGDDTCSVQIRHSRTDCCLTGSMPYHLSVIVIEAPVPDFDCIFKAVGVRMEEVKGPCETTVFTGPRVFRGSYTDAKWRVRFVEVATPHGPVLLLSFRSPGWMSFGAQMLVWPAFHKLRITRDWRRPDACNVRFQCTHDSRERVVPDVRPAVRMLPLPFLSEIRDAFTTRI